MFLNTLNTDSIKRLTRALALLDWEHMPLLSTFMDRHRPAVLQAVRSKQRTTLFEKKMRFVLYVTC